MITGIVIVCSVLAVFGVLAGIVAALERLPTYPPAMYDDTDDVLPEPMVRAQRYQPSPESEWIIE